MNWIGMKRCQGTSLTWLVVLRVVVMTPALALVDYVFVLEDSVFCFSFFFFFVLVFS